MLQLFDISSPVAVAYEPHNKIELPQNIPSVSMFKTTVLNNLIRTQGLWNIQLTVYEEYHLLFLVRTCAKML